MVGLALGLVVIGVVLLIIGAVVSVAKFLLWLGIVVAIVGAAVWVFNALTGRHRTTV